MLRTLVFLLILLASTGCTKSVRVYKITEDQAKALVNARAGLEASAASTDPNLPGGARGFLKAALTNVPELPEADFTPAELLSIARATDYARKGAEAEANPPEGYSGGTLVALGLGALSALTIALKIGRNIPGIAGTISGVLSMGIQAFAPDKFKQKMSEAGTRGEMALRTAVQYAHDVEELLPPDLQAEIKRIKAQASVRLDGLGPEVASAVRGVIEGVRRESDNRRYDPAPSGRIRPEVPGDA